jgi:signal transduction histidine kinase
MAAGQAVVQRVAYLSRNGWLLAAAVVPVVTALEAYALRPVWRANTVLAFTYVATAAAFVLTGLLLKDEPGQRGTGWALILAGVLEPLGLLNRWNFGPMPLYAWVFGYLDEVFGAWALLRYPNPRLRRHQRVFLVVLAAWVAGGPAFLAALSRPGWQGVSASAWWLAWFPDRPGWDAATKVFNAGALILCLVFIALLMARFFRARGMDRLVITPVVVAAVASAFAAATVVTGFLLSIGGDGLLTVESAVQLVVPLAFLISVIQRPLARARLAEMTVELAGQDSARRVQEMLRRVLHDPHLDIGYWDPATRRYVDSTGQPADPGHPGPGRLALHITGSDGTTPLAVILADRSTVRDGPLLQGALGASRMALENARLQGDLQEQLKETRASRARIVEAGLAERKQLERNLHDGAQQRLLGLAAQISAARVSTTDPEAATSMERFSAELLEALSELRALARGILPPVLEQSGIAAAAEGVIEHVPIPVLLEAEVGRFPAAIEATAYFVISEALTNTVKHAQAGRVEVIMSQEHQVLLIQVKDDGRGGADPRGAGLAALADRVATLGGTLVVASPPGEGTHLRASLPCA